MSDETVPEKPNRREFMSAALGALTMGTDALAEERLVVLTFDDAVRSHRTFVAPLLRQLGFGATFFVTHAWMADRQNFMTWEEIAELHRMGFEVGNHSWTHAGFNTPRAASRLAGELALVESALSRVGVPRPVSFAHCGNAFCPESLAVLRERGYRLARRGMQPEVKYGENLPGPVYHPERHHPLLIPTSGDAYPGWTLDHFRRVVDRGEPGGIIVLQFHGVPDTAHPWVHTPPERFREYMAFLKERGFRVVALRDILPLVDARRLPDDPLLKERYPVPKDGTGPMPVEVEATRKDLRFWLSNMLRDHRYTPAEAARVAGMAESVLAAESVDLRPAAAEKSPGPRILPYPGGRHPRIGFREGAVNPLRGTKASVFLPWDPASYIVVDLPEAIFSHLGLLWLAHTHIPTVWDEQNVVLENIDWSRDSGPLRFERTLPNGIRFGASIRPEGQDAAMELWLRNETTEPLRGLTTQVCMLLGAAAGFNAQTAENKRFLGPVAAVPSEDGDRWILTAWQRAGRVWGNPPCPCIHSDPVLPDCPPGETARVHGRLRFYEGKRIEEAAAELAEVVRRDTNR